MSQVMLFTVWVLCVLILGADAQSSSSSSSSSSTGSAGPLNPSNGLPPVITRVSGCIDLGNVTVNCPKPTLLTVYGTGFMTGLENEKYPLSFLTITLDLPNFNPPISCAPSYQATVNDTYLQCSIYDRGFGSMPTDQMIPIIINNRKTQDQTPPFPAFSMKNEPAPVVTGVKGCRTTSPDGFTTYSCDLLTDTITVTGSGFTSIDRYGISFSLGTGAHSGAILYLGYANPMLVRYSDIEIVFTFANSYQFISVIDAQEGQPLPLRMKDVNNPARWSVETVWVQFTNLPDPIVTKFVPDIFGGGSGCTFDNVTQRFGNCVSGLSSVTIQGKYFFEGTEVYIGGQKAPNTWGGTSTSLTVTMPVFEFTEGVFYDVEVRTVAGSVTVPAVIEFNTDPIITGMSKCVDDGNEGSSNGGQYTPRCMPGQTLTLSTMYVKTTAAPRVVFQGYSNASLIVDCQDAVTLTRNSLQCTMPEPPSGLRSWQYTSMQIYIEWASGEKTNKVTSYQLWEPKNAPRLSSISGCYSNSGNPLHANQCLGNPDSPTILTLTGVRFAQSNWSVVIGNWMFCEKPELISNDQLTCALPPLDSFMTFGIKYSLVMSGHTTDLQLVSNAAYITFVDQISYDSAASSSSNTVTIALATVFSIVGAALLIGAIVYISRRLSQSKQRSSEMAPEFSTTSSRHVELSEI